MTSTKKRVLKLVFIGLVGMLGTASIVLIKLGVILAEGAVYVLASGLVILSILALLIVRKTTSKNENHADK